MIRFDPLTFYESTEEAVVWVELEAHGEVTSTGEKYSLRYAQLYRIAEGKIACFRDYWNPVALATLPRSA